MDTSRPAMRPPCMSTVDTLGSAMRPRAQKGRSQKYKRPQPHKDSNPWLIRSTAEHVDPLSYILLNAILYPLIISSTSALKLLGFEPMNNQINSWAHRPSELHSLKCYFEPIDYKLNVWPETLTSFSSKRSIEERRTREHVRVEKESERKREREI